MTKHELIRAISERSVQHRDAGVSKTVVAAVLDTLADVAHDELKTEGGEIPLPGLGKLKAICKPARTGRNPRSGEPIDIPPRNGVKWQMSKDLKTSLS